MYKYICMYTYPAGEGAARAFRPLDRAHAQFETDLLLFFITLKPRVE